MKVRSRVQDPESRAQAHAQAKLAALAASSRERAATERADAMAACVWTRVFCHSSLSFVVPIGILHIKENWGVK
jgi:hypothetical protein